MSHISSTFQWPVDPAGVHWSTQERARLTSSKPSRAKFQPLPEKERSKPEKVSTQKQKEPTQEIEIHGAVQQLNIVCNLFTQTHTWLHGQSK